LKQPAFRSVVKPDGPEANEYSDKGAGNTGGVHPKQTAIAGSRSVK
jgi:hypothetical protein